MITDDSRGYLWSALLLPFLAVSNVAANVNDATFVSVKESPSLQELLNKYQRIYLESNQDFTRRGPTALVLSTGDEVYCGAWTMTPRIVVPAGVSDFIVDGCVGDDGAEVDVEFTGGDGENNDWTIVGANRGQVHSAAYFHVVFDSGSKINRGLLLNHNRLTIRHGESGYIRDSRFERQIGKLNARILEWKANRETPSFGNFVNGVYCVTCGSDGVTIDGVENVLLNNVNAESWGSGVPVRLRDIDNVIVFGMGGSHAAPGNVGRMATVSNVRSYVDILDFSKGGDLDADDVYLESVRTSFIFSNAESTSFAYLRDPTPHFRASVMSPWATTGARCGPGECQNISKDLRQALNVALTFRTSSNRATPPTMRPLDDPLGASWNADVEVAADAQPQFQRDLDADGELRIPCGTYHLRDSLMVGRPRHGGRPGDVVAGERPGCVNLIATGSFPIIRGGGGYEYGRDDSGRPARGFEHHISIAISNLNLYGGSAGIDWSSNGGRDGVGDGAAMSYSTLQSLNFLHQRVAGIRVTGALGMDGNSFTHLYFYDEPFGIYGDSEGRGAGAGMTYNDKLLVHDAQFRDLGVAAYHWKSERSNGGQNYSAWSVENSPKIAEIASGVGYSWVNSSFHNVYGDVAVDISGGGQSDLFLFAGALFAGRGATVLTDTPGLSGVAFIDTEFAQRGGSLLAGAGVQRVVSWNSRVTGSISLGGLVHGLFIRSVIDEGHDRSLTLCLERKCAHLDPGKTNDLQPMLTR